MAPTIDILNNMTRSLRILLGATGSVAAIRVPELYAHLKKPGHQVKVVATQAATHFFDPALLDPVNGARNPDAVILDADEWPAKGWQRGDPVKHIELRSWAELLLIAPLDANTLAKLACGLADNCLTCVWRAWDFNRPVVLAPAMNTLMWENPLTAAHLIALGSLLGTTSTEPPPTDRQPASAAAWINRTNTRLRIVPPQSKQLACGDTGMGALAALEEIVSAVANFM